MKTPRRSMTGTPVTARKALPSDGHRGRDVASGKAVALAQPGGAPVKKPVAKNLAQLNQNTATKGSNP